ncbi:MAG: VWA domain-containing protein [Prevotella sp.]|nr:VWA domain-containing protein [Prevotella sp.]
MKKRVFNLIIVDESGSMSTIRKQAFEGINETLTTVQQMQEKFTDTEQRVTLITFDSNHIKWHYNNTPAKQAQSLKWSDYEPCAATPLYDAIGRAVTSVEAQTGPDDNVLVTIITDGWENASREWTLPMVRQLIEKLKKQNWTFALIGTDNLDVESMAANMAIEEHLSFRGDACATTEMFRCECKSRMRFNQELSEGTKRSKGRYFSND